MDHYLTNLEVLKTHHPHLVSLVEPVDDAEKVQVLRSESGQPRVVVRGDEGEFMYIHSAEDPVKCAAQVLDLVDRSEKEGVFVLLGFGLGYLAEELLAHFDTGHVMLVYEATPVLFKAALRTRDLSGLLGSDKVKVLLGKGADDFSAIHEYHHHIVNGKFWVVAHKPSVRLDERAYEEFRNKLQDQKRISLSMVSTAIGLGKQFMNTFMANLPTLLRRPGVASLKGAFEGRPAIVVAAGPSLEKNLHLLKQARSKVVVVAVDAALPTLASAGVIPDVIVGIDPLPDNAGLFRDNPLLREIPFVCLAQYTPDIVRMYPGPLFMDMVEGNLVYQWLRGFWEEKGCIECFGGSVAHLAFATAEYLGASTIALTGLDLSFDSKLHAGETTRLLAKEDQVIPDFREGAEMVEDVFGEKRYTLQTFLTFRTSFETRIANFSGFVVNATEGGLPIAGADNVRLADFLEEHGKLDPVDTLAVFQRLADTEVSYNIEGLLTEIASVRKRLSDIRKYSLEILKCIHKVKALRRERQYGDEFHRTIDRIERVTEKVRDPILNFIAAYHYQLELYLKRQEIQDVDDIDDSLERLDAQLERGLNYYGELVEAVGLFTRELTRLERELQREKMINAVLADQRLSETERLTRVAREYKRAGLVAQRVRYLERLVELTGVDKNGSAAGGTDARIDLAEAYVAQFRFGEAGSMLEGMRGTRGYRRIEKLMRQADEGMRRWEERSTRAVEQMSKNQAAYGGNLESGDFYFRTGSYEKAEAAYLRAVEEPGASNGQVQPDTAERAVAAYYGLAHTYLVREERQRAVDAFVGALQIDPENPILYRDLGLLAFQNGNIESAEAFLLTAIDCAPCSIELHKLLSDMYVAVGDLTEAIATIERAVTANPENPFLQEDLAQLYHEVVRRSRAENPPSMG